MQALPGKLLNVKTAYFANGNSGSARFARSTTTVKTTLMRCKRSNVISSPSSRALLVRGIKDRQINGQIMDMALVPYCHIVASSL